MTQPTWALTLFPAPRLKDDATDGGNSGSDVWWSDYGKPMVGRRLSLSLEKLRDLLCEPRQVAAKFLVPYYLGGHLVGDRRETPTLMECVSILSVDVDDGAVTIDEAELLFGEVAFFLYTTASHTPEHHRYRLVFPLARPVAPDRYGELWAWAHGKLGKSADESCKDPTRVCLLPVAHEHFAFIDQCEGTLLNPDDILTAAPPATSSTAAKTSKTTSSKAGRGPLRSLKGALAGTDAGARDTTIFRYACSLRARGVSIEEAHTLVQTAAANCTPPFPPEEAAKKVDRVWDIYTNGVADGAGEALEVLEAAVRDIEDGANRRERCAMLAALLQEPALLGLIDLALTTDALGMEALLTRLDGLSLGAGQKALRKEVKSRKRLLGSDEDGGFPIPEPIRRTMRGRKIAEVLRCPAGYFVSANGIWQADEKETLVASDPILVTGILTDLDTGGEHLRIEWFRGGQWQHAIVSRERALNARHLVDIARQGAPVTSSTARAVVDWLAAFEALNYDVLLRSHVTRHLGWQGDGGSLGFLWGSEMLTASSVLHGEQRERASGDTNSSAEQEDQAWCSTVQILHDPRFGGGRPTVAGLHARGDLAGWSEVWRSHIQHHPRLQLAVYAALIPPLLEHIRDAPRGFTMSYSGETGTGKTTGQRCAASLWGEPRSDSGGGCFGTWSGTITSIEYKAALLHNMPLILDDTKELRDPTGKKAIDSVYMYSQGIGRARVWAKDGESVNTWAGVMFSSGEAPLCSLGGTAAQSGGAAARVIEMWGPPLGEKSPAMGARAMAIRSGLGEHYGHVGPAFVRWLLQHPDHLADLPARYKRSVAGWRERADGCVAAIRGAEHIALLDLAAWLFHEAFGLPGDALAALEEALESVKDTSDETDRALIALRDVYSWVGQHQGRFYGRHERGGSYNSGFSDRVPSQGWLGRWDAAEEWEEIAILPHVLRRFLLSEGYDHSAVLATWRERGWTVQEAGRRTARRRIDGSTLPCLTLSRHALEPFQVSESAA